MAKLSSHDVTEVMQVLKYYQPLKHNYKTLTLKTVVMIIFRQT